MTSWQDQQTRDGASGALDASSGAPRSRREAREAERRAAEARAGKPPHPSGVVDFDAHDFSTEFAPDQEFNVGDTQDIWAALTRGQRVEAQPTGEVAEFRSGVPEAPAASRTEESSVSGELLDRVRDAVLRRGAEAQRAAAPQQPSAFPQQAAPQQPAAFPQQTGSNPQQTGSYGFDASGLTRRQRREQEIAGQREDGLPGELFVDPRSARSGSVPVQPQQSTGFGYGASRDDYYDAPYTPEPTISIPRQAVELEAPTHVTNPIGLPHAFTEPTGDDALTFSSPVPVTAVEHHDEWATARVDPSFLEPEAAWAAEDDEYDEDDDEQGYDPQGYEPQGFQPRAYAAGPIPAAPSMPFVEPQSQFRDPQLGPPSEVTDLAGFEALIRKARQQPQAPAPIAPSPALAWADEEEVQEGFTGLLSRSVQGSHGSANALILPNDPQPDLTQAVTANGDIFITGSMNLPRSLSTTGAPSELYDSHEIDRLYEASQDEPASGVAPVRASKAVSGAPHDRGFASAPRRRGNILPTVLAVVAGVMAVGVVTLLVGSWVLKLF
jgi:hypothetical protein